MQTLDVVRLGKEIHSIFKPAIKAMDDFRDVVYKSGETKSSSAVIPSGLRYSSLYSVACATVRQSASYTQILHAFGFADLLDPLMAERIVATVITEGRGSIALHSGNQTHRTFDVFVKLLDPLASLTAPPEITALKVPPEVVTIEIEHQAGRSLPAELATSAISDFIAMYDALVQIRKSESFPKLSLINLDGGSLFRFDLKGGAEIIREVKVLLIDVWHAIRNAQPDAVVVGNKIAVDTLKTISTIRQMKNLSAEETEGVCRLLHDRAIGFLTKGARIAEIVDVETINNQQLLTGFQQRLLPAPAPQTNVTHSGKKRRQPKKKSPAQPVDIHEPDE
ncbi:MAG: hypothetical protein HZB43_07400 [candidate division Zixibacteria bacterium]|nr:hypothetical protein [candidate division Zixibacteria bacterium]